MNLAAAKKHFGQHFLVSNQALQWLGEAIAAKAGEQVVEIGPGRGALTALLLHTLPQLHAVEIDRDCLAPLRQRFGSALDLHHADALEFDFGLLPGPLRLVGNLSYAMATELIFRLQRWQHWVDAHFMLQLEVAQRLVASAGHPSYSRLSVMAQSFSQIHLLHTFAPACFEPAPAVDSAFVRLVPHAQPAEITRSSEFAQVVALAFSQRRKMLRNNLKSLHLPWQQLQLDASLRAQDVPLSGFIELALAHREQRAR